MPSISAGAAHPTLHKEKRRSGLRDFIHWNRDAQLEAFFAWLPKELHDAPGIEWKDLPVEIMRYCVSTIGSNPDTPVLAAIAASLHGTLSTSSQRVRLKQITNLLRNLRATGNVRYLADLEKEHIWYGWAQQQEKRAGNLNLLRSYAAVTKYHFPLYLQRLHGGDRQRMQQYALPACPADILKKYFPAKQITANGQAKRKAETDILVPLYPILRQIIRFRKQLAERVLLTIREARHQVDVRYMVF